MTFAGINYLAVLSPRRQGGWRGGLVHGTREALDGCRRRQPRRDRSREDAARRIAAVPVRLSACVVMAWVLAGLIGHLGQVTVRSGVISGVFCWLGFVITTMLVNNSFAMRSRTLLLIDGGYWLVVLALMGAIIGAMGA